MCHFYVVFIHFILSINISNWLKWNDQLFIYKIQESAYNP